MRRADASLSSVPRIEPGCDGSPAFSVRALATSLSTSASPSLRSTITRSVDMQICPWLKNAPNAMPSTAASRSASSSTSTGALPPSSSSAGFRCRADSSATMRPTRVEPVKFTRLTSGFAISRSTIAGASCGACESTLTTPSPSPASCSTWPISRCTPGQPSEAFSTTVLPQASGIASARVASITGAFQGAMPSTTPHGCRTAIDRLPGTSDGITAPSIWVVMAAASRSMLAASMTLKPYQFAIAPVSAAPVAMNSGVRSSIRSAAASSRLRRSVGDSAAQPGNARAAAATAASASSGVAAAARVATAPVAGLIRSKVPPFDAGRA